MGLHWLDDRTFCFFVIKIQRGFYVLILFVFRFLTDNFGQNLGSISVDFITNTIPGGRFLRTLLRNVSFLFHLLFKLFLFASLFFITILPLLLLSIRTFRFIWLFFVNYFYRFLGRKLLNWTANACRTNNIIDTTDLLGWGFLFYASRLFRLFFYDFEFWLWWVNFWLDFRAWFWTFPFWSQKVHHWASNLAQCHFWSKIGRWQLWGLSLLA